jgi:protein-arginine kinase activator protein McsA
LGRRIDALNEMKDAAVQEANYEQAMLFRAAIEELDELRMSSQINQLVSAQFDLY